MLAIGRALMLQPTLMMIDELSLGLAPLVVQNLVQIVRDINATGVSIILVEQSANLALSITDHAYFIEKGQLRFDEVRSEEHTSELQSRPHLVCRLLLEKKKKARQEP